MGVANTKATGISNADNLQGEILSNPYLVKGPLYCAVGTVAVASTDTNGSVYRFARIPSGCRLNRLDVFSDAISGFTSGTIGLYNVQNSAGTAGTAVSAALFGTAIDFSKAQTEPYDAIFNNLGIANVEKRIWELLGLTQDPMIFYDVVIVGTTLSSSSGNLSMRTEFTI